MEATDCGGEPLAAPSGVKARGEARPRPFPAGEEAGLSVRPDRPLLSSGRSETRLCAQRDWCQARVATLWRVRVAAAF